MSYQGENTMRQKIVDAYAGHTLTIFLADESEAFITWHTLSCQISGLKKDSGLMQHINNTIIKSMAGDYIQRQYLKG
jgi:hypothetical protein